MGSGPTLSDHISMKLPQRRVGNGTFAVAHAVVPRCYGVGKIAMALCASCVATAGDFAHPTSAPSDENRLRQPGDQGRILRPTGWNYAL